LAPHDISLTTKGVALSEKDSTTREPVVDGIVKVYVLPRVLYLQVHVNGNLKKKN
jgi:hypothetical protein